MFTEIQDCWGVRPIWGISHWNFRSATASQFEFWGFYLGLEYSGPDIGSSSDIIAPYWSASDSIFVSKSWQPWALIIIADLLTVFSASNPRLYLGCRSFGSKAVNYFPFRILCSHKECYKTLLKIKCSERIYSLFVVFFISVPLEYLENLIGDLRLIF